jgi:hypothetical protein
MERMASSEYELERERRATLAEIGRMLNVTRQRAHQLAAMEGFPAPAGETGSRRFWKRADVEKRARKAGRLS